MSPAKQSVVLDARAFDRTLRRIADEIVELRNQVEADVRSKLRIPFNSSTAALRYEHSMGQFGGLPPNILRQSTAQTLEQAHSDVRNRWIPLAQR